MGGGKGKTQEAARNRSRETVALEHQRAAELHNELQSRLTGIKADTYGEGGSSSLAKAGAVNLRDTGGYDTSAVERLRSNAGNLAITGGYDPEILSSLRQQVSRYSTTGGYEPGVLSGLRDTARTNAITGGYDPDSLNLLRRHTEDFIKGGGYDEAGLSRVRGFQDTLGGEEGYGREGYQRLADTGGFTPEQEQEYLQFALSPTQAVYARNRDEIGRRVALQGGYSPGFDAGTARAARRESQDLQQAGLAGRTSLEEQKRRGVEIGLGGLASTRAAIEGARTNKAQLAAQLEGDIASGRLRGGELSRGLETDFAGRRLAGAEGERGLESDVASRALTGQANAADLERLVASGRIAGAGEARAVESNLASGRAAGQDALQRYLNTGVQSLNSTDLLGLQNRLQAGNISMEDAQLLAGIARDQKGLFEQVMQGISTVGGAVAGIGAAF